MQLIGYLDVSDKLLAPIVPVLLRDEGRFAVSESEKGEALLTELDESVSISILPLSTLSFSNDFRWETEVLFRIENNIVCFKRSHRSLILHMLLCKFDNHELHGWKSSLAVAIPDARTVIDAIICDRDRIFDSDDSGNDRHFLKLQFAIARRTKSKFSMSYLKQGNWPADLIPSYAQINIEKLEGRLDDDVIIRSLFEILYKARIDRFTISDIVCKCWSELWSDLTESTVNTLLASTLIQKKRGNK